MTQSSTPTGKYVPKDPVVRGSAAHAPVTDVTEQGLVLSGIVGDNRELIAQARRLWIAPTDTVADVTWGRGAFWPKHIGEKDQPQFRYDLATMPESVDCRELPNADASLDVVVFDPPYRPGHGGNQDGFYTHYGLAGSGLDSMNDVLDLYRDGIREAFRVLRVGGRVLVKCQDMTYSERLHLVHLDVIRQMQEAGFQFVDMFVLVNINRRRQSSTDHDPETEAVPPAVRQHRARRSHSYLLVGIKPKVRKKKSP